MAPLPPAPPTVAVLPVMFGQTWTDPNGGQHIAEYDGVLLQLLDDKGNVLAIRWQTPESAIGLGLLLQNAAVQAINAAVDDNGKHPSLQKRMERIDAAYGRTKS